VTHVPVATLHPAPWNPRTIEAGRLEQLKRSLTADPQMLEARPLVALPDGTVIMGNQRLRAVTELGWETVNCVTVELDEATAKSWALRDNQNYGEWEASEVAALLRELDAHGMDLDLTGFDDYELNDLLDRHPDPPKPPPDEPVITGDAQSVIGEVYELGEHRLLCGDATNAQHAELLMGDDAAALLFTSPPYGDARSYDEDSGADLDPRALAGFLPVWANHAQLIACNLGILRREQNIIPYWDAYLEQARLAGLKLLAWNIWDRGRTGTVIQQTMMFPLHHEFIFVWGSEAKKLNRRVRNADAGVRQKNRSVLEKDGVYRRPRSYRVRDYSAMPSVTSLAPAAGSRDKRGKHPAVFPIGLPQSYIEAATMRGEWVVDPFAGSGTTMLACEAAGRRCAMVEISPYYCDVIRERWRLLEDGK
jgi:DNA modification methylase